MDYGLPCVYEMFHSHMDLENKRYVAAILFSYFVRYFPGPRVFEILLNFHDC
jgi:hypothetical protein